MKSKITIDLAEDNQPVIKIQYVDSEDVRDKMIKRFIETFSYSSVWVRWSYEGVISDCSVSTLRPIPPKEMKSNAEEMLRILNPPIPQTCSQTESIQNEDRRI